MRLSYDVRYDPADRIQFLSMCVFTLDVDALCLRSITVPAIQRPLEQMCITIVYTHYFDQMPDARINSAQIRSYARRAQKHNKSCLLSK